MKLRLAVCTILLLLGACRTQTPPGTPSAAQVLVLKGESFGNGGSYVELPNVGTNESVAVIPLYAAQSLAPDAIQYRVTPTGLTAPAVVAQNAPAARPAPSPEQKRLEAHLAQLEENRQLVQKMRRAGIKPLRKKLSPSDVGSNCPAPYTVGSTVCDFYIIASSGTSQALINTTLRFESANAYWFVDNVYANELTQADFVRLGQTFENEVVPVDTQYFGNFSDIDGNSKIFIVFSSFNLYGYVFSADFLDDDDAQRLGARSNEGDIFYAYLPSDNVRFEAGNPDVTPEQARQAYFDTELPSTLVHELKHLISYGVRIPNGAPLEEDWAEEASGVAAEELSLYGSAETGYAQGQAQDSLKEPEKYRVVGDENTNSDDGTSFYGYNFLLFWRIAERVGHENFWRNWTAGPEIGVANVEKNAPALGSFADMMADWSTTLMFSNTGLVSGYDYSKLNLRDGTWQPLAYRPLSGEVTGNTRSLAAYVGRGTGQDVTLKIQTNDLTPYAVVVRFTGALPY